MSPPTQRAHVGFEGKEVGSIEPRAPESGWVHRKPLATRHDYSQVGNLKDTTYLLALFYVGFIGVVVVLITDY